MRHEIFDVLLLICCVYAVWRGGAPERIAGATLLIGDLLSVAVLLHAGRFAHEEYGLSGIDFVILVILTATALRSRRWWPLILAGLQLDGVLVHFVHLVAPHTLPLTYLNATALWAYPMVLILAVATWRHRRRLAHFGEDPAWRQAEPQRPSRIAPAN